MKNVKFGWIPQKPDERDYSIDMFSMVPRAPPVLPTSVDIRSMFPPIVDQGAYGSCTANAGAGLVDAMEMSAVGKFLIGSRFFLYWNTRKLEGSPVTKDTGATIRGTMGSIAKSGICKETTWPYVKTNFSKTPIRAAVTEGMQYQGKKYALIDQPRMSVGAILYAIKSQLAAKIPLECGFYVFPSYEQASSVGFPYPASNEQSVGGHAIDIVGYDDSKVVTNPVDGKSTTGAFLIRNSWGTSWGEQGYGWIPYDYVTRPFQGQRLLCDVWALLKVEWMNK